MSQKTTTAAPRPRLEAFIGGGPGTDTRDSANASAGPVAAPRPAPVNTAIAVEEGPTQRLSIDLPIDLHTRFKMACAKHRTKMAAKVLALIERETKEMER